MWIFRDVEERSQNTNLGTECQGEMDVMQDDCTYVQRQFPEIPRRINSGCKAVLVTRTFPEMKMRILGLEGPASFQEKR